MKARASCNKCINFLEIKFTLTQGGEPLDSSRATPIRDVIAPNHVKTGMLAPSMPSSRGTIITLANKAIQISVFFIKQYGSLQP